MTPVDPDADLAAGCIAEDGEPTAREPIDGQYWEPGEMRDPPSAIERALVLLLLAAGVATSLAGCAWMLGAW